MLVYVLAALGVFGLAAVGIHLAVMDRFERFAAQNREQRRGDFIRMISTLVSEKNVINQRGLRMAMRRFGVRGVTIRDTTNATLFEMRLDDQSGPGRRHPLAMPDGALQVWREDLIVDGRVAGRIEVQAIGDPPHFAMIEKVFTEEVLRTLVIATGVATLIFGFLSWSFARTIARPLEAASEAAGRIAGGDLAARLTPGGVREVAELADDFNRMADSLARKESVRTRMTSDIAHELRTPVSVLKSHLEGIRDGILPADEDEVLSLLDETGRLERIINDLRAIWELENAGTRLRMETLVLDPALARLADRFRTLARTRGITIGFEGAAGCRVLADESAFERALSNILSNAIKYGRDHGQVLLTCVRESATIRIGVRDDGPGIPEADLPHVFERFYRADEARARSDGGAGLGLAIAAEAIAACQGSIWAENNPEGGCTFFVRLPLA